MDAEISFGLWLEKRRKALDLTREELAQKVGCSISALRKIESDERHPSKQLAKLLANGLDIPADERPTFVKIARGELSIGRLKASHPLPDLSLFQPPQTLSNPIPIPPTPLIGRETELASLLQMLGDPQCRLITLVGPGGIGKTRLAIEAAHNQSGAIAHGAAFVSLADVNSTNLILSEIAGALNFRFHDSSEPKKQLLNHLRDKQIFLVLDNLEHLLDGIGIVGEIIEYAPQVKALCTSREQLNLHGEWVFEVGGLRVPQSEQVEKPEDYSAVALFIECARRTRTSFALRPENQFSIVRICQLVAGVPLAIELAASWVRSLSCQEISQEIERGIDILASSVRDLPERHRSMHAVFDHSWKLLSEEERDTLMRLSVFQGGFTREAAEQVAGANLELLSALIAKSFVLRSEEKRFSLHELVRRFAAAQFQATEQVKAVKMQHIAFFTDFAETGRQHFGSPSMAEWMERMEQDNDNLRAALDYIISLQASQIGLRLGAVLWRFWEYCGQLDEGRHWLKAVLALPTTNTDEYALQRAKALNAAGALARIQGDLAQARSLHEEGLAVQRKIGNVAGIATALNNLGIITMFEGRYDLAETYFQESLKICRDLGLQAEIVKRLNNLGVVAMYQGGYEKARLLHEEAMGLYRELNDQHGIAGSLGNLGDVLRYEGKYDRAMQVLEESLAILDEVHDEHGTVITLDSIARVHLAKGDVPHALAAFHTSLTLNRRVGDKTEIATTLEGIADALGAHARQSKTPEDEIRIAVRLLSAAGQLRAMVGAPRSAAERVEVERINAQLKDQLPSNDFASETEIGKSLTTEQAVEAALHHLSHISNADHVG